MLSIREDFYKKGWGVRLYLIAEDGGTEVYKEHLDIQNVNTVKYGKVYIVLDTKTGEVFVDNGGKGYKSHEDAVNGYVSNMYDRVRAEAELRVVVRNWITEHKQQLKLLEIMFMQSDIDYVYLSDFFKTNGLSLCCNMRDLVRIYKSEFMGV